MAEVEHFTLRRYGCKGERRSDGGKREHEKGLERPALNEYNRSRKKKVASGR